MIQAEAILAVLSEARVDFLVERTPTGVRVETESRDGRDGISCEGSDLVDALGQVTQVLAAELGEEWLGDETLPGVAWLHNAEDDVDAPAAWALEPPVAFAPVVSGCIFEDCDQERAGRTLYCEAHLTGELRAAFAELRAEGCFE